MPQDLNGLWEWLELSVRQTGAAALGRGGFGVMVHMFMLQ